MAESVSPHPYSGWPPASTIRDTCLLIVGLVLVAALADGELATWLTYALVAVWGVSGFIRTRGVETTDVPFWWYMGPFFAAIAVATVFAEGEWFWAVVFAVTLPLILLFRLWLSIRDQRQARRSQGPV